MTRKQIFLVIFRVNSSTVVTIRGLKATEEGKPASVKVSFQVRKTGKASKYSYVSKVNVIDDKLTMTAAATKVKQITVTFNKAVDIYWFIILLCAVIHVHLRTLLSRNVK